MSAAQISYNDPVLPFSPTELAHVRRQAERGAFFDCTRRAFLRLLENLDAQATRIALEAEALRLLVSQATAGEALACAQLAEAQRVQASHREEIIRLRALLVASAERNAALTASFSRLQAPPALDLLFEVLLPIKTVSEANIHGRMQDQLKRKKAQRQETQLRLRAAYGRAPNGPATWKEKMHVVLTRIGPGRLDSDNSEGACKHVRDGVADWLKIDDGDPRITWKVEQEKGEYAVRVQIYEKRPASAAKESP